MTTLPVASSKPAKNQAFLNEGSFNEAMVIAKRSLVEDLELDSDDDDMKSKPRSSKNDILKDKVDEPTIDLTSALKIFVKN